MRVDADHSRPDSWGYIQPLRSTKDRSEGLQAMTVRGSGGGSVVKQGEEVDGGYIKVNKVKQSNLVFSYHTSLSSSNFFYVNNSVPLSIKGYVLPKTLPLSSPNNFNIYNRNYVSSQRLVETML